MSKKFLCTSTEPVVGTKAGKLRGFFYDGTYTFHGIKYADAKRFQMPTPVEPWEGVRDALGYGYIAPLLEPFGTDGDLFMPHRLWPENEHCQYLNIWSPSLERGAKKPVMVWLHGGGFSAGSSIEQVAYEGANLCRYGDVVVVTLNHRLNILGYLDLSEFGAKYANSGNAGMADIVEALRWIRENIAGFGGDPDNVTLFGQSGGGAKASVLCQVPEATGLFHKAIIMSGIFDIRFGQKRDDKALVTAMLRELGLSPDGVEALETLPYPQLADVLRKAGKALGTQNVSMMSHPVANDWYLGDPMEVGFTENARMIPTMAGTVIAEFSAYPDIPGKHALSAAARRDIVAGKYGEAADELIRLFRQAYPGKNEVDLVYMDTFFRSPTLRYLEKKSAVAQAPVYSYMFSPEFSVNDGKPAWHCADIPFAFHNCDIIPYTNIDGVTDRLEEQFCGAYVNFARSGNPNHAALPHWSAFTPGNKATMVFDRETGLRVDYEGELLELLEKAARRGWPDAGEEGLELNRKGDATMLRIVQVENGAVQGLPAADPRITSFKGIPFAAPPVGENRWRAPKPARNWDGIFKAYDFAPISMQAKTVIDVNNIYTREWSIDPDIAMDEDCLYLNVWTPANRVDEKLPVYVWYFGGGLQVGHTAEMEFDGERIARRGIVVVTVNYRLNVFGFLCHPEISAESPDAPANFGHLDQKFGTEWVKRNIAAFGGDPGNITIGGQSAGGGSVLSQLTSPQNEGLFQKAIVESGIITPLYPGNRMPGSWLTLQQAEQDGVKFLKFMGVPTLAEARKLGAEYIRDKSLEYKGFWGTVVDNRFCVGESYQLFLQNKRWMVPVMMGHTSTEFFSVPSAETPEDFKKLATELFGGDAGEFLALCGADGNDIEQMNKNASVSSIEYAIRVAGQANTDTGANAPIYYYNFDAEIPDWDNPGTFHSVDLWFFFETLAKCWRPFTGKHYDLARQMCNYWAIFIRSGDPNGKDSDGSDMPSWETYSANAPYGMLFADKAKFVREGPSKLMQFLVREYFKKQ